MWRTRALLCVILACAGYEGALCQLDVDECQRAPCGEFGTCVNTNGSFLCLCPNEMCGERCSLPDPCLMPRDNDPSLVSDNGTALGPCENGGVCHQRCTHVSDYLCQCVDGYAGKNCSEQEGVAGPEGSGGASTSVVIGIAAALGAVIIAGGVLLFLAAQARNKRATRGTYSPSSQEYCNPRVEHLHNALKPPPEERLI